MEDELLYHGRFDHIGDRKLNSIRLFISSTFSDTTEERNGLIDHVYPRLREYCLSNYKIQFQYSDMRWGIQSTAADSHTTVDMCLQELDVCCRLSMATNCVIFLSHRYGSRFAPVRISSDLFQHLLFNTEEKEFLNEMYRLDENYLEKKYFLRSITDELEQKLRVVLQQAADRCYDQQLITQNQRDEFHISVTAQEIYRALENNKQKSRRIICFFRDLIDIDDLGSKFRETECEQLLTEVKQLLRQSIDPASIYSYQLRWKDEKARKDYLSKFYDDFYHAVQSQIDYHMNIHENRRENLLYNQIFEHAIQCNLLIQRFFPRPDIFQQIKTHLTSSNNSPCVLLGHSGTGKSSIMAKLVKEIPSWYDEPNHVSVIVRFLGATPSSSDIRRPLISIIEQICSIYHFDIPTNFDHVKQIFENILSRIPTDEQLVLLFDSLDQLQVDDVTQLEKWLPENLQSLSNVKCIYSTIPNIEIGMERKKVDIHQQLKTIYQNDLFDIQVQPFSENTAEEVLKSWLAQDRRQLTSTQFEWLRPKLTRRHQIDPLFLSLLYDQTLTWHSYDETPDKAFLSIESTGDAIEYLYNQLGAKHGQLIFHRAMHYLQLAGGLSELEIEDILSLDDEVLQSVFVYYLPPFEVFRLPSNLWIRIRNDMHKYLIEKDIDGVPCIYFYHRTFQQYEPWKGAQGMAHQKQKPILEKIRLFYFANQYKNTFDMSYSPKLKSKYNLNTDIIQVNRCLTAQQPFQNQLTKEFNLRRIHQLYLNIARYEYVHNVTLFNLDFLRALLLCGEFNVTNLLYQFTMMNYDGSGESRYLLKQFELSLNLLNQYPSNLAFELVYRLYPFRENLCESLKILLGQCLQQCPLLLLTDDQRQDYLFKCPLSKIIYSKMSSFSLIIVTDNNRLYQFHNYFRTTVEQLEISFKKKTRDEKIISAVYKNQCLCCLTSNDQMISMDTSTDKLTMQISCNQLIYFVEEEIILIIVSSNHKLQTWNCLENSLVSEYDFGEDIIEDYFLKKTIIKVSLKLSRTIVYLSIDDDQQLKIMRTVHQHRMNYEHRVLLDLSGEFFYSLDRSTSSLVIYDETNPVEIYNDIDWISLPKSVFYLSKSNSIAWLTDTSVMIFNPLYEEKIFQPFDLVSSIDGLEYDDVSDNYSSVAFSGGLGNLLACIVKDKGIVDIYEWFYDKKQQKHVSYLLSHVKLEISIEYCTFEVEHPDGITLYCSDGTNLYKHNATMLYFLVASKQLVSSERILHRPSVYLDRFLAYTDDDQNRKIFTLNDKLEFHLSIPSVKECYFTSSLSHILVINRKNQLAIYSLKTKKLLWISDEFQHRKLQISSLASTFICFCSQTSKLFQIDTQSFQMKTLIQLPIECLLSTIDSFQRLFFLSKDQTQIVEFNLINHKLTNRFSIQLNSKSQVIQIYANCDQLILHNSENQVYLWENENQTLTQFEDAYFHLKMKDNLLVLVSTDKITIVFHDLQVKSRQIGRLDDNAGQCEALCLSNRNKYDNEQYLFVICSDRLLRMFSVSTGEQMVKIFINMTLDPFLAIVNDRLLLKIADRLCLIQIIDRKSLPDRSYFQNDVKCPLFENDYWLRCHDIHFA